MSESAQIIAIGPADELLCLKTLGVEVAVVEDGAGLEEALERQAARAEGGVILVSEAVTKGQMGVIAGFRARTGLPVLVVPSYRGARGLTLEQMTHALEQCVGVDLISKG